jgi:hypothetical protein
VIKKELQLNSFAAPTIRHAGAEKLSSIHRPRVSRNQKWRVACVLGSFAVLIHSLCALLLSEICHTTRRKMRPIGLFARFLPAHDPLPGRSAKGITQYTAHDNRY